MPRTEELRCSFCNKSQGEIRKLIAGPTVFICDECVEQCQEMIKETAPFVSTSWEPVAPLPHGPEGPQVKCALCGSNTPAADVIRVPNRGVLCLGCAGDVEAAIAERRQSAQ